MPPSRIAALGLLTSLCLGAGAAEAGWVIDQVVSSDPARGRHQVVLQANRLKTLLLGPDGKPSFAFILDLNAETITQVDFQERRYLTAALAEYVQALEQVRHGASAPVAQAPPQEECPGPRFEVRKTEQRATIAGYPAIRYEVLADGKPDSEVWIAPGITAWREIDREKLEQAMTAMANATPRCIPGQRRPGVPGDDPAWKLASVGYAVRTVERTGTRATIEVVKAEERVVPDAEFQAPPGFARRTLREMLGRTPTGR